MAGGNGARGDAHVTEPPRDVFQKRASARYMGLSFVQREHGRCHVVVMSAHRLRRGEFSAKQGGQEEALLPERSPIKPGGSTIVLRGLAAHRRSQADQEDGQGRASDLEPRFLALERVVAIGRADVVVPLAAVYTAGCEAQTFDVSPDIFQILAFAVEGNDALAGGALEMNRAVAKDEAEQLAQDGRRWRGVAQRQELSLAQEVERLACGIAGIALAQRCEILRQSLFSHNEVVARRHVGRPAERVERDFIPGAKLSEQRHAILCPERMVGCGGYCLTAGGRQAEDRRLREPGRTNA